MTAPLHHAHTARLDKEEIKKDPRHHPVTHPILKGSLPKESPKSDKTPRPSVHPAQKQIQSNTNKTYTPAIPAQSNKEQKVGLPYTPTRHPGNVRSKKIQTPIESSLSYTRRLSPDAGLHAERALAPDAAASALTPSHASVAVTVSVTGLRVGSAFLGLLALLLCGWGAEAVA
jgi:hypothetical protein